MNLLSRYVTFELLKVFLITLSAMTAFMLLVGLVQEAVRENLTPATILNLIPYVVPNALCFAIPGTMLFSTCLVLGRMSAENEIVAIKSMGISPMSVVIPVLVLAFLLSLVTVYLNDLASSWGRKGMYRVVLNSVEKTIYSVLSTQRSYQNGRVSIVVDDVVGQELLKPRVQIFDSGTGGEVQFQADRARLVVDADKGKLIFAVTNAVGQIPGQNINGVFPEHDFEIDLSAATRKGERKSNAKDLPLNQMAEATRQQKQEIERESRQMALQAAFQVLGGDLIGLTHARWNQQIFERQANIYQLYRLQTEPWRRWANGFSCLCFVIVAAPLAIYMKKADFWNTFAICFIPILLCYYPLLMYGVGQAKSGDLPPPIVWLGNLVLLGVGWILSKRIMQN